MPTRQARAWASLAVIAVGALMVSMTASVTRDDAVFALGSWAIYVVCTGLGTGALLAVLGISRRALHRPATVPRRMAFLVVLLVAAVSFPVEATWEEEMGGRARGLVPAAQALAFPVWPRSAWETGERPRDPLIAYAYTCCG